MRRSTGIWAGVALVLLLGISAVGTLEVIQRRRFATMESLLDGALQDIRAELRLEMDAEGKLLVRNAADSTGGVPRIVSNRTSESFHERARIWFLSGDFNQSGKRSLPALDFALIQQRTVVLESPFIQIGLNDTKLTSLPEPMASRLKAHGLTYRLFERR